MPHCKERFISTVRILAVRWDAFHHTECAVPMVKLADQISPENFPATPEITAVLWVAFCVGLLPMPEPWMITKSASDFQPR
jgi:hypothetical protein